MMHLFQTEVCKEEEEEKAELGAVSQSALK